MERLEAYTLALCGHSLSLHELDRVRERLPQEFPGPWDWADETWILGTGENWAQQLHGQGYATLVNFDEEFDLMLRVTPKNIEVVYLNLTWEEFVTDGPARSEAMLAARTVCRLVGASEVLYFPDCEHPAAVFDSWAVQDGLTFEQLKKRALELLGKAGDLGSPLTSQDNYFLDTVGVTDPSRKPPG